MARSAANEAELVAEALEAFIRDRPASVFGANPGQAVVPSQDGEGRPVMTFLLRTLRSLRATPTGRLRYAAVYSCARE